MNMMKQNPKHFVLAMLGTNVPAWGLTLLGIYGRDTYGIFLFIALPTLIGYGAAQIWRLREEIPTKRAALGLATLALLFYGLGLLVFAIEGIICLLMSAPLAIPLAWLGALIATNWTTRNPYVKMGVPLLLIPGAILTDDSLPSGERIYSVKTPVVIEAPPAEVWKYVVAYAALPPPSEMLFRAGVAYPESVVLRGSGVGAVRECHFSTGPLIEPIVVWEENRTLEFEITEQPVPMKEMTVWDIDPPHLHGFLTATRGRFDLVPLEGNRTLLTGTSSYTTKLKPEAYWNIWCRHIAHKIHERVFRNIKEKAEGRT